VWAVSPADERKLDELERVGECYTKEEAWIEFWSAPDGAGSTSLLRRPRRIKAVIHVDRTNTEDAKGCNMQYSYRMNQAIIDGVAHGIPQSYVDKCIKPFLASKTNSSEEEMIKSGMREAIRLGIDLRKLVAQVEDELALSGPLAGEETKTQGDSVLTLLRGLAPQESSQVGPDLESSRRRTLTSGL
jgi:hypothetical protein